MRRILQHMSAVLFFLVLTIIVFSGVVTGRGVFFTGDISQHYIPWETFVDEEIESGRFPHWDPHFFGGHPIHAEGQSGILYPVTRLVYLLFDGALAFSIDMLIHLMLGGFFVYLLARSLKLGYYPALYAGAVFTLAGYPVSLIVNAPILRSVTWIPLIALLVWHIWHGTGIKGGTWLSFVLMIQIFAGSIQVVAMTLVLILFMSIFLLFGRIAEKKRTLIPIASIILIGVPLAFILGGAQILPTNELYQQSFIHLDLKEDMVFSFSPYHLFDLIIPPYWAQNKDVLEHATIPFQMTLFLYLGIIPFLMMLIGFIHSRSPWTWKLIAVIGLLMGLGEHTFFYSLLLKLLPPLGSFRAPDRFLVFYALAASILAGYGFRYFLGKELPQDPKIKRKWYVFWGIVAIFLFLLGLIVDIIIPGTFEKIYFGVREGIIGWTDNTTTFQNLGIILRAAINELFFAMLLLILFIILTFRYRKSPHRTLFLGICIFLLSIIELVVYMKMNPGTKLISPDYYKSKPSSVEAILSVENINESNIDFGNNSNPQPLFPLFNVEGEAEEKPFRITPIGYVDFSKQIFGNTPVLLWYHGGGTRQDFMKFREILNPNLGNVFNLDYISGISSLYTSSWNRFMEMVDLQEELFMASPEYFGPRIHLWDLAGVKYIVSNRELVAGRLELIHSGDVYVYRNRRALSRAFIIYPEKALPESQTVKDLIMKGELDLAKNLVIDTPSEDLSILKSYPDIGSYSPVRIEEYTPTRIKIKGVSIADGYLVLTDAFYPGWECTINGKKEVTGRAYFYFRAVPVKAGQFDAVFTFKPNSFRIGVIISILGAIIWVFLALASITEGAKAHGFVEETEPVNE